MAVIFNDGRQITIGRYKTAIQAAAAYNKKAEKLFGSRAILNKLES